MTTPAAPGVPVTSELSAGLTRFSRGNAAALLVAAAVSLALGVTWPLVAVEALLLAGLVRSARGRYTPHGAFGVGNTLTLLRGVLAASVGLAPPTVPMVTLGGVVLVVFALDGLDGWVAKQRGETSEFGAHFDMELDAWFVLLLGCVLFERAHFGAWILSAGLLRYVYVLTLALVPSRGAVPRSRFGRHAFTGLMLGLILGLVLGKPFGTVAAALGCGLVTASFVTSFYWSYAARR